MSYVFDPDVLHEIARSVVGQPMDQLIEDLAAKLSERYPGQIRTGREWVLNNAGGAMGSMMLLHASLTEYLIIFGTPIGTEGASGRFPADDYFYMLEGEHWSYAEGDLERTVTRPGEVATLKRGQAKGYRLPNGGWGMEYARGAIPLMFPFGFADTFTSTLDFVGFARTMKLYSGAVLESGAAKLGEGTLAGRLLASVTPTRRTP